MFNSLHQNLVPINYLVRKNVHRNLTFKHEIVTTLHDNNVRLTATEATKVEI